MVQRRTTVNFFYAFGIKERTKGRWYEGKRKQGIDWIPKKFLWITIELTGLYDLLKVVMFPGVWKRGISSCVNLDAQKQWTGLAKDKDKPFNKEPVCLGHGHPLWSA